MIWTSIIWFGIVLFYISQFFGWSNLFLMMPDEFGGFLAGVTLPLAILWVVVAYIDRGTSFKTEARLLRSYMNQLVYPEEGAAQTAKAMADGIRSQVVELQNATKMATEQSQKIKNELNARVEDFAGIITTLDQYSSQTVEKLSETLKQLTTSFEMMNEKALSHSGEFKNIGAEVSGIFAQMCSSASAASRSPSLVLAACPKTSSPTTRLPARSPRRATAPWSWSPTMIPRAQTSWRSLPSPHTARCWSSCFRSRSWFPSSSWCCACSRFPMRPRSCCGRSPSSRR